MNKRLQALLQRRAAAVGKMKDITAAAGEAIFTEEQTTQFDALKAEIAQLDVSIEQTKAAIEAERSSSAIVLPDDTRIENLGSRAAQAANHGFASFGEFVVATYRHRVAGAQDERLQIGAATLSSYGNESSVADGGFLIPPEYSSQLMRHMLGEESWLPLTSNTNISGNTMSFPKSEVTPWGTDGIRAYWEAEASAATQTKPKGQVNTLRMNKLMALVPVTDELQADAVAMGSYVSGAAGDSIIWKANEALFNGTGAGQPEGVFASAARVDVAKEGSQTADTVVAANVAKMYARQINPSQAVWLVNHMVLPQLIVMTIGDQPIWTPPTQGIQGAPNGLLLGRPIVVNQHSKQVGDVGDIGFVNFKYVRSITKAAGIETASSMHLFFDQGLNCFRFTYRLDAKPWLSAAVTPANGSDSLSPFVFLADRA